MKKAHYRFIPAYFNPETGELIGRNRFYDLLIDFLTWFEVTFDTLPPEGFPIWIEADKTDEDDQYFI